MTKSSKKLASQNGRQPAFLVKGGGQTPLILHCSTQLRFFNGLLNLLPTFGVKLLGVSTSMKRIIFVCLLVSAASTFGWSRFDQSQNSYLYPNENSTQSKLDEMQRRLDQAEFERQMDLEEQRAAAEEAQEAARLEAEERAEQARQEAEERAEQARQEAEDRAAEIEKRERIASARKRTVIYESLTLLALMVASYKILRDRRNSKGNVLKSNEKAGVVIGVVGGAIMICALFVSSPWNPQLDFWQNIMQEFMTIDVWPYVQTKFIVLSCLGMILYGALVYLEIFKAPKLLLSRFE